MKSSAFSHIVYDHVLNELTVTFDSGARYRYSKVSVRTWNEFQKAASKGRFLNNRIVGSHRGVKL